MTPDPILEVTDLAVGYGLVEVVKSVTLRLPKGNAIAILGALRRLAGRMIV